MALGIEPMPVWIVARSGIRSATNAAMRSSSSVRGGGGDLDERPVDLDPAEHLADVDLVASERARLLGVGLEEEAGAADERGGVVGVDAEAEVAVPIGR